MKNCSSERDEVTMPVSGVGLSLNTRTTGTVSASVKRGHSQPQLKWLQKNDKKLHKISLDFPSVLWYNPLAIEKRTRSPGCVYLLNRLSKVIR